MSADHMPWSVPPVFVNDMALLPATTTFIAVALVVWMYVSSPVKATFAACILISDPSLAKDLTAKVEPRWANPIIETLEPKRAILRRDNDEPRFEYWHTDKDEPKRETPIKEKDDASRAQDRSDSDEPTRE